MNPQQPSGSVSYNTAGSAGGKLATILMSLLFVVALAFGIWAFMGRQDYKNKSDAKVAAAVEAARKSAAAEQKAADDQAAKAPYKTFHGSPTYGSLTFNYPKTWSAYVDTTSSNEPIDGYFHPGVVPGIRGKTAFALRAELVNTDYSQVLRQYDSLITQGKVKAKAYVPPKLKGVANVTVGTYLSGQVTQDNTQNGYMLVIRVRDKTLLIYTESSKYLSDFNKIVLAKLTFSP